MLLIRKLTESDADALLNLRLEALREEPEAFRESIEEFLATPREVYAGRLRRSSDENFALGAFAESELVGMAGFYRESSYRRRHKGTLWGVFLRREYRGKGDGRALVGELIRCARLLTGLQQVILTVAVEQHAARELYYQLGFRRFGREPGALLVEGRYIDEEYLALDLISDAQQTPAI